MLCGLPESVLQVLGGRDNEGERQLSTRCRIQQHFTEPDGDTSLGPDAIPLRSTSHIIKWGFSQSLARRS